jgi:hypothetical protein
MNKGSCLGDGTAHCYWRWIVRARVRTAASAVPAGETVAISRCGTNRDSYSAVFPPAAWTHPATGPVGHCQEILGLERRHVGRVGGRRDGVRDCPVVAPLGPYVLNACATALRRCRGNSVARPGTQENLCVAV